MMFLEYSPIANIKVFKRKLKPFKPKKKKLRRIRLSD